MATCTSTTAAQAAFSPASYSAQNQAPAVAAPESASVPTVSSGEPKRGTSLGKRAKRSSEDMVEIATADPEQQPLARKKLRTKWDGSPWKIWAIDITPLETPPVQLDEPSQIPLITNSPVIPSPPQPANPELSAPSSDTVTEPSPPQGQPPRTDCGHAIHPAYADTYREPMCPTCLIDHHKDQLKSTQDIILEYGGIQRWRQSIEHSNGSLRDWNIHVMGGFNRKQPVYRDNNGDDISYRHKKRMLHTTVRELETLSEAERVWEERQPEKDQNAAVEQIRLNKEWSATNALQMYKQYVEDGVIDRLEEDCKAFARKRGRDWQVAALPDYPGPEVTTRKERKSGWTCPTAEQRAFIKKAPIPFPKPTDVPDLPPKRERRRKGPRVSFNDEVYVRTDADIDSLRLSATSLSEEFLESASATLGSSTTGLSVHPMPSRPHIVIPLSTRDGQPRDPGQGHSKRNFRGYKPEFGKWAVPDGKELVDTSGRRKQYDEYRLEMDMLHAEMADMETEEKPSDIHTVDVSIVLP
ncbi:hypothetical protein BDW02DRAFT_629358 [Decorospora gaudefroyi]|uniref:Uncharacterized protein n=1 Tax=Decorospora gaudefroyi TaxID=184978 RepID=A0A6A5KEM6_9PLEO|nr:hypothetical protein BDW02DRAFT_629358 [Decorospora gaudefroyi]